MIHIDFYFIEALWLKPMLLLPLIVCSVGRYHCTFHVQECSMNSVAVIQTFINAALTSRYENDSITIQTMDVTIKHIGKLDFLKQTKRERSVQLWNETWKRVFILFQSQKTV